MNKLFPIFVVLSLAFASLACTITINAPAEPTRETRIFTVNEAAPAGVEAASLTIEMGAGTLNISGGAKSLVEGTIQYNIPGMVPEVSRDQEQVRIKQSTGNEINIPNQNVLNDWDLQLGTMPMALTIKAGAYEGNIDLTGLALTSLSISDGASQTKVRFDAVNLAAMDSFTYRTGASQVELRGIGNANTGRFDFEGGAGDFTLDFSGDLQRDMTVTIKSGISSLTVIVPEETPARVNLVGGLSNISPFGTWTISGNTYEKEGSGPRMDITIEMGLGSLKLISQ